MHGRKTSSQNGFQCWRTEDGQACLGVQPGLIRPHRSGGADEVPPMQVSPGELLGHPIVTNPDSSGVPARFFNCMQQRHVHCKAVAEDVWMSPWLNASANAGILAYGSFTSHRRSTSRAPRALSACAAPSAWQVLHFSQSPLDPRLDQRAPSLWQC